MRMLSFGENFRGARPAVPCPFSCPMARDSESHLFDCLPVNSEGSSGIKSEDFLQDEIPVENIKILQKLMRRRESLLEQKVPYFNVYG